MLLEDGRIVDSAALPEEYVPGTQVTVTAENFLQTLQASPAVRESTANVPTQPDVQHSDIGNAGFEHPITFSGGSIMDSGSVQGHAVPISPGSTTSTLPRSQAGASQQGLQASPASLQGHALTMSPASMMTAQTPASSIAGHPLPASEGSILGSTPGSLQGFPITYSQSSMGSVRPASEAGRSQARARQLIYPESAQPQQPAPYADDTDPQVLRQNLQHYLDTQGGQVQYHAITTLEGTRPALAGKYLFQ